MTSIYLKIISLHWFFNLNFKKIHIVVKKGKKLIVQTLQQEYRLQIVFTGVW